MVKGKQKFALWLTPEAKSSVEHHFQKDNCQSQSEYIEKAIRFYSGYLDAEHADSYLPRVLAEVLEGKLSALGSRIGKLLFKLSVDDALMCNLVAASVDIDLDTLKLGYDHAPQWRNLIRAHRNDIAAAMNIPPSDFRWYAAFHDEGNHPHIQ